MYYASEWWTLITAAAVVSLIIAVHAWFHFTNPYARGTIVRSPYRTKLHGGKIRVERQFSLKARAGFLARLLGYWKSGFLIVQNAWFGSYRAPSKKADDIIDDIHRLRFNPDKPYLISGDQFSVLYVRNLGVFYNTLLDHRTAHSEEDWENRQRIYLQSALYALDAFTAAGQVTTTIVPISSRRAVLTQVHPGSIASDSMYGLLYALERLVYAEDVATANATKSILQERSDDLARLLEMYLHDVRDKATGLVKRGLHLASARDGALRDSSFYDNVILWSTLQLAKKLEVATLEDGALETLRAKIISTFWDEKEGYFHDDQANAAYSSDWLIALPTEFLSVDNPTDLAMLERAVAYTKAQKIDEPFPIRYTATNDDVERVPWAVRTFVPNYGGDAIWSYWGAQYIWLLAKLYGSTGKQQYHGDAERYARIYRDKIEESQGFPETFDREGNFLQNAVYKSIRQTGWVVQFEAAEAELRANEK